MIRVRLKFDSVPSSYARKCWFTFDSEKCRLVGDVSHLITAHFNLKNAKGIQLYMDDYLVPTNENASLIRDNDILQVRAIQTALESSSSSESLIDLQPSTKWGRIEKMTSETINGTSTSTSSSSSDEAGTLPPPPPPKVKKLVAVTKKSASGGTHTTFQSSSSGESSSSSSSSDDDDDDGSASNDESKTSTPSNIKTQWDVKKKASFGLTEKLGKKKISNGSSVSLKNILDAKKKIATSGLTGNRHVTNGGGASLKDILRKRADAVGKGKRFKRKKIPSSVVIGGPRDVLTTKTILYTSPLGKEHALTVSAGRNINVTPTLDQEKVGDDLVVNGGENTGEQAGEESADVSERLSPPEATKDYTSFPDLQGPPRIGDRLAFKVLELSSDYTPEVSEYLDAIVTNFDPTSNAVNLKYTGNTLQKLSQRGSNGSSGKFALDDEESTEDMETPLQEEVSLTLSELIEPKLTA